MLLSKNPQFLSDHYEILTKEGTHEVLLLTKFRNDWVKIVDFLDKAFFLTESGNYCHTVYKFYNINTYGSWKIIAILLEFPKEIKSISQTVFN